MRITILTIGSQGDVQPYIALGKGLQAAGHHASIATSITFESLIRKHGLEFAPIRVDMRELAKREEVLGVWDTADNPVRLIYNLARCLMALKPQAKQILRDAWQVCQKTDVVIAAGMFFFAGEYIAQALGTSVYLAATSPMSPTVTHNSGWLPPAPTWLPIGVGHYNKLSHTVGDHFSWQFWRLLLRETWSKSTNRPRLPFWPTKIHLPVLYGYSPVVVPRPDDWSDNQHITGYWFLESERDWQPSADLVGFLQSGPPPVCIGFGSVGNRRSELITDTVLQALRLSNRRGVLLSGWGGLSDAHITNDVFRAASAPHNWLFPQMAAVVHHGGAGTTAAGLRAGVPTVVVPFFGAQPFWGQRVYALGVGPKPIPYKRVSAAQLAEAITIATSHGDMKHRALALSQQIRAEDGVSRAVELIFRGRTA